MSFGGRQRIAPPGLRPGIAVPAGSGSWARRRAGAPRVHHCMGLGRVRPAGSRSPPPTRRMAGQPPARPSSSSRTAGVRCLADGIVIGAGLRRGRRQRPRRELAACSWSTEFGGRPAAIARGLRAITTLPVLPFLWPRHPGFGPDERHPAVTLEAWDSVGVGDLAIPVARWAVGGGAARVERAGRGVMERRGRGFWFGRRRRCGRSTWNVGPAALDISARTLRRCLTLDGGHGRMDR